LQTQPTPMAFNSAFGKNLAPSTGGFQSTGFGNSGFGFQGN